jgi:hypothetical protein
VQALSPVSTASGFIPIIRFIRFNLKNKKMKTFISLLVIVSFALPASAQLRLNGYTGYTFDDNVDSYYDNSNYYEGKIKGGFQWGVGLEFQVRRDLGIELSYLRMDTKAPITYFQNGVKFAEFDLGVNYIMLGGNRYFRKSGSKVEGFGGLQLGVNIFGLDNPTNGKSSDKTFFAWGLKGGMNYWASEKVAIKIQAGLLSAVQSVGGGFYFGTGGSGAGLASYSTIYQFTIGGGIVVKIPTAAGK